MSQYDEPLESGAIADIARSKALYEQLLHFHWEYFAELAYKRIKIYDSLKASLRDQAKPFEFSHWQRVVKYKYCLDPLSTNGSLMDPGGRFNIGAVDKARFPLFPALYLASDKRTAMAELLGRSSVGTTLSPEDLALTAPASITVVSVSGKLEAVLDIREQSHLAAFVDLVSGFQLSRSLLEMARKLNAPVFLVKTAQQLSDNLHYDDWRQWPMLWDVPAPSQIFGRIALDAQVEAILYASVLTKAPCLCMYHQNFQNSPSFVELDDPAPAQVIRRRLDATNCVH